MVAPLPTRMANFASCVRLTEAERPSLRMVSEPVTGSVELVAAAVTVTDPVPSPEAGDTENPVPLTLAVQG